MPCMGIGMENHRRATIAGDVVPAREQLARTCRMNPLLNENLREYTQLTN